jgi:hypothetical protein
MDLEQLIARLQSLDEPTISRVAGEIDRSCVTASGEIDWWTARIEIDRRIRIRRLSRTAGVAAARAVTAVRMAAARAGMAPDDGRVDQVARAAADVARAVAADVGTDRIHSACPHLLAAA